MINSLTSHRLRKGHKIINSAQHAYSLFYGLLFLLLLPYFFFCHTECMHVFYGIHQEMFQYASWVGRTATDKTSQSIILWLYFLLLRSAVCL